MHPDLAKLLELQDKDLALLEADQALDAILAELESLDQQQRTGESALDQARRAVADVTRRRTELEGKIDHFRKLDERGRQRLEQVRAPKEIQAVMTELDLARSVLAKEEGKPEALFVLAKVDLARQRYEEAIASLRRAVDARPDWSQAHYLLGTALFFSGDAAASRGELVRSIELDPNAVDGYKLLTRVHAKLGDNALAVEAGERALARDPGDVATRIHVAQSLVQERRFDEALYGEATAMATTLFVIVGTLSLGLYWAAERRDWR